MILVWLIVFIVLLVIEIFTMGLTTIWFAGGALVALLAAALGLNFPIQLAICIVVSVVLLVVTRPIAVKYFNQERQKTNAEGLIGQQALVLEDIDTIHGTGRVVVNGLEWSAKTDEPDGVIERDRIVSIEGIQGVKLIVKEKEE